MRKQMSRRNFVKFLSLCSLTASYSFFLSSCAIDPVTGKKTMVMLSTQDEINLDHANSPHQLSADYGIVQDHHLNTYLNQVGTHLSQNSHRPQMPYSFQGVNASYINAYAFPGGTIACTRGMLVEIKNEAELAALLGHEIGHVNARHMAEQATVNILAAAAVMGATIYASTTDYKDYTGLVQSLGGVGLGALLAHYSRDNEREADRLGMEYMVRGGYDPNGMLGLIEILLENGQKNPAAIDMMFATHPMSTERFYNAQHGIANDYNSFQNQRYYRERYMDNTFNLRKIKGVIQDLQHGDTSMKNKKYHEAENAFNRALHILPYDYAAIMMMAKCQLALGRPEIATQYTKLARQVYPQESQSLHVEGVSLLQAGRYQNAIEMFNEYQKRLPGNTDTLYFMALSYEGANDTINASKLFSRYIQLVPYGSQTQYAQSKLSYWGLQQPTTQQPWQQYQYQQSQGVWW